MQGSLPYSEISSERLKEIQILQELLKQLVKTGLSSELLSK